MKISHVVTTACLLLAACNNDTPTGALTVPFQLGSNDVCSYKGLDGSDIPVEEVRVALYTPGVIADDTEPFAEETVDCADGQALFTTVNAGKYTVIAEGLNADGRVVFDNGASVDTDFAEVLEGQDVVSDSIRLTLTPVKLNVRWQFKGFEFNQCTQVPLTTLTVDALRDDGNSPLGQGADYACDQPADGEMGYHRLADDARALNGNDLDTVEIAPKDMTNKVIGDIAKFQFDPPGPGGTVNLSIDITCTATTCDLSCAGDPCRPD